MRRSTAPDTATDHTATRTAEACCTCSPAGTLAGTAVEDLTADLRPDGRRLTERRADSTTLERDGAVLAVATVSDGKATEVVLTLG